MNQYANPRLHHVKCLSPAGFHRMAYAEWGAPDNPRVLVCVHGLTRVGRDFDRLARALASRYRVVCPDVVGRGRSEWLRDPNYYVIPQYIADLSALIARLGVEEVDWVGTSMGGLIGIMVAGQAEAPIRRLVINDVGPRLDAAAIARIGTYLGAPVSFASVDEAIDYVSVVAAPFGVKKREDWRELVEPTVRRPGAARAPRVRASPRASSRRRARPPPTRSRWPRRRWRTTPAHRDRRRCARLPRHRGAARRR